VGASEELAVLDGCLCGALHLAALALGAPLEKADDVLAPGGFERLVLGLLRQLRQAVAGGERVALDAFLSALGQAPRPADVNRAAREYLGLTRGLAPEVEPLLRDAGASTAKRAKRASAARAGHTVAARLDVGDQEVVDHLASSTALYVRDQYGRRADSLSARAREVVAAGVAQGLDRYEVGRRLRAELSQLDAAKSDAYYRGVAQVFMQRARTFGAVKGLAEAGLAAFEVSSLNDESSCDVCRFMDGKVFGVRAALQRYAAVAAGPPEAVQEEQPWLAVGRGGDGGERLLYYRSGGERVPVADVLSSAAGQVDQRGTYAPRMTDAQLQSRGVGAPPYHFNCRCLVVGTEASPPAASALARSPEPAPPPRFEDLDFVDLPEGFKRPAEVLQSGELGVDYAKRMRRVYAKMTAESRAAIKAFTGNDFANVRHAEAHTDEELAAEGWTESRRGRARRQAGAILAGLRSAPPDPLVVFRSLKWLDREAVDGFLAQDVFEFGVRGRSGTSSASWDPHASIWRFMDGAVDHPGHRGDQYKVLFVVRQRSGVGVEGLSNVEREREVMLPAGTKYRKLGVPRRLRGTQRVLVVEVEEV
jgi:hypothetical protein